MSESLILINKSVALDANILKDFGKDLLLQKRRSPVTVKNYTQLLARFFNSFSPAKLLSDLQTAEIQNYVQKLGKKLAPSSQALHIGALRCFFKWCVQKEHSKTDYSLHLLGPKIPKRLQKVVDEEELPFLLKTIAERPPLEQLLFELLYGSGLRISEAFELTYTHVNLAGQELRLVGKGRKERRVPLTPRACKLLADNKKGKEANASLWELTASVRQLQRWTEKWGQLSLLSDKSGHLHAHKLRHSLATHLLRRGAKLPELQKLLGHERLSTTERYTHLNFEDLARVYDKAMPAKLKKRSS